MSGARTVLVTGAGGQLGTELIRLAPAEYQVVALSRDALDVTAAAAVAAAVRRYAPAWVINAAAYTAVDAAEDDAATAFAVNRDGAGHLARAARAQRARLLHVSTDFVFDGRACRPYRPEDRPAPLGVYGRSKLAGEQAVRSVLGEDALIVRTAWVYAADGRNFLRTMLRLMQERGDGLRVVADQVGTPTAADGLAAALWSAVAVEARGTLHWTDAGVASWYDFAVAIQEEALAAGCLRRPVALRPVATEAFPTRAARPPFGVLDKGRAWACLGPPPEHWRSALRRVLRRVAAPGGR